jgi:caa(3)-type oxidase subunit IV
MSTEALTGQRVAVEHQHHGHTQFYVVWAALLVMTGIEVLLAYEHLQPVRMLSILLGLSIVKAALIILYFMHMKFEVTRMRRVLMLSLAICLCLMCTFFPDAFRILHLGVK